jgi:predicted O-methyltransferase YrrM
MSAEPTENWRSVQTLAGNAVLLEIGARLGVLSGLPLQKEISVADAARTSGVEESVIAAYFSALAHAGLLKPCANGGQATTQYEVSPDLQQSINEAGYLLWSLTSCGPLIANTDAFFRNRSASARTYFRDGEHVARTSRWMGEQDFYPQAENAILSRQPKKIVDLGSGTCGLLIRLLRSLPGAEGVGVEISHDACVRARSIIKAEGLDDRLSVVEAPIQSLIENPAPIEGAEIIHAGWVFHDLLPEEEKTLDALLKAFYQNARTGALVIVEGVPYAQNPGEHSFSAAYTFLHSHFMGRKLLTESEWKAKLLAAGYRGIQTDRLGISGGRIFTVTPV